MNKNLLMLLAVAVFVVWGFYGRASAGRQISFKNLDKPRVIVLTDITHEPDADNVSCRWFQYREAGTLNTEVKIENSNNMKASLTVPKTRETGTLHIICEVKDNGKPPLYSYRRVVLNVKL
jgi:hypothetical protein